MKLKNVTLELSSKAFRDDSDSLMREVCRTVFTQWKPLTDDADQVSVMLWIADGSEIFEYAGKLDDTFEWAYWLGCATPIPCPEGLTERQKTNTHFSPVKYIDNPKPRSYRWLQKLVATLKEMGRNITGKPIRVGATYDNGPEFIKSDFKFRRHREICQGNTIFKNSVVTCTATLHEDSLPYAAFPKGIPEGTTVGEFLGAQYREFSHDLGFDYLWLSNGMGFGTETWGITGMLFDKEAFHPEKADEASALMMGFWNAFFKACPDAVIETRGSNFSAGLEIATDACPLRELYRRRLIAPPVNSPWAALNFNTGLELAAWMSHVAELPDDRFPFRFYIHDPWFLNSPWLDRYEREPWDIFQPLSIGRVCADGTVAKPNSISFLSVDDSWGRLPDQVPLEVIPLLKDAFDNGPDAPGPFVWLYPFDEYTELVCGQARRPDIVFTEDFFIGECLQNGMPLNTVVSTATFRQMPAEKLSASTLVVPVSAAVGDTIGALEAFLAAGGNVIFYGAMSYASPWLQELLQMVENSSIHGDVEIENIGEEDILINGEQSAVAHVFQQYSCGGLTEFLDTMADGKVNSVARQGEEERVTSMSRRLPSGATVGFVRCLLPAGPEVYKDRRGFDYAEPEAAYPVPSLMRKLLDDFGWRFRCYAFSQKTKLPRTCISRNDNAFFFTVFAIDTTVEMHVNTPWGAPILTAMDTMINEDGDAVWHPARCWHKECRLFVKQKTPSVISAVIDHQAFPQYHDRKRRHYRGLKDAEVRFFVPTGFRDKIEIIHAADNEDWTAVVLAKEPLQNVEWESTSAGECAVLRHITGALYFCVLNDGIME